MKSYLAKFRGQRAALPPRLPARKIALAGVGAALAIGSVATLAAWSHQPLLLGSLGASCVFLFGLPEAPFSQPRNVLAGHGLSSLVGLIFLKACGPHAWALGLALGTAVALMFATRTVHAPAGSNPVIVFLAQPGWGFLLAPTLLGAAGVVLIALLFNNAVHPGRYPLYWLGRDDDSRP
ncbi:MAG: HPP family protein [Opitutae bacterium]|nr:HPP family protein [Opitutae bacterium]